MWTYWWQASCNGSSPATSSAVCNQSCGFVPVTMVATLFMAAMFAALHYLGLFMHAAPVCSLQIKPKYSSLHHYLISPSVAVYTFVYMTCFCQFCSVMARKKHGHWAAGKLNPLLTQYDFIYWRHYHVWCYVQHVMFRQQWWKTRFFFVTMFAADN